MIRSQGIPVCDLSTRGYGCKVGVTESDLLPQGEQEHMNFILKTVGIIIVILGGLASFLASQEGNDSAVRGGVIMAVIGLAVAALGSLFKSKAGS